MRTASFAENRKIERLEACGVSNNVDLSDFSTGKGEFERRKRRPRGAMTMPTAPSTKATRAKTAPRANVMACRAQAWAPRAAVADGGRTPRSALTSRSGSSMATGDSKSPERKAERKASATLFCSRRLALRSALVPRTRRRARLASWRVAAEERPMTAAISSNDRSKVS